MQQLQGAIEAARCNLMGDLFHKLYLLSFRGRSVRGEYGVETVLQQSVGSIDLLYDSLAVAWARGRDALKVERVFLDRPQTSLVRYDG
jgi:hypothetical protein